VRAERTLSGIKRVARPFMAGHVKGLGVEHEVEHGAVWVCVDLCFVLLPVATGCCTLSWREVGGKIIEACGGQLEPIFREVGLYKLLFRAAQLL